MQVTADSRLTVGVGSAFEAAGANARHGLLQHACDHPEAARQSLGGWHDIMLHTLNIAFDCRTGELRSDRRQGSDGERGFVGLDGRQIEFDDEV